MTPEKYCIDINSEKFLAVYGCVDNRFHKVESFVELFLAGGIFTRAIFNCVVPRPLSVFHLGQSVSDHVAPKRIDREGLGESRTGTWTRQ